MASIFQNLEIEAFRAGINPRTQESRDWFRKRIGALRGGAMRRINRNQLLRDEELSLENRAVIGNMYMFFYDPKWKKVVKWKFAATLLLCRLMDYPLPSLGCSWTDERARMRHASKAHKTH